MTIFILSKEPAQFDKHGNEYPRRVILDHVSHGEEIETIDSNAVTTKFFKNGEWVEMVIKSAWRVAREKVDESKFNHFHGDGWYALTEKAAK